jgi:hypothetical protein
MYVNLHAKCHLCEILMELEFSRQIFGTTQISNSINICPAGADGYDETNIHFTRFCERA